MGAAGEPGLPKHPDDGHASACTDLGNIKRLKSGCSSRKRLNGAHGSIQTEADFIIDKSDSSIQSLFHPPYQSVLFPISPAPAPLSLVLPPNLHFLTFTLEKIRTGLSLNLILPIIFQYAKFASEWEKKGHKERKEVNIEVGGFTCGMKKS